RLDGSQCACDDLDQDGIGGHRSALVSRRLPNRSTSAWKPGWTGTVEPNSWTTAGPSTTSPEPSSPREYTATCIQSSNHIRRRPAGAGYPDPAAISGIAG